jgi:uncharacterized protein YxjI
MRYVMKQKFFSWGDDFTIQDEHGRDAYFADGKVFSLGDKLSLHDGQGNEVAAVRQKLLSLGRTYEIYRNGELKAVVKKGLFDFFRTTFAVDVPGPDDLEAQGNFLDHEYRFTRRGEPVAQVSKKWFSWTDTYGVEVAEDEDDVLILAAALVIDMCCHDDQHQ